MTQSLRHLAFDSLLLLLDCSINYLSSVDVL